MGQITEQPVSGAVDELPPLPFTAISTKQDGSLYTIDDMHAYAAEAVRKVSRAQQAPAAPSYEQQRAIMEAERNAAADDYFKARPQIDFIGNRRIFESGFQRGFESPAALSQPAAAPVIAQQAPAAIPPVIPSWVKEFLHSVEDAAFAIPAPNVHTPKLVMLCAHARTLFSQSAAAPAQKGVLVHEVNLCAECGYDKTHLIHTEWGTHAFVARAAAPVSAQQAPAVSGGHGPFGLALNTMHTQCHQAADAFWRYWNENGETHKRGYYESTWGAINAAIKMVGVVPHTYGGKIPASSVPQVAAAPVSAQQAPQESLKVIAAARTEIIKSIRAYGEKSCADYIDKWLQPDHIAVLIAAAKEPK